jgi:hypothetical protein
MKNNLKIKTENQQFVKDIFKKSLNGERITFFDWECQPRFIQTIDNQDIVNYRVNFKNIFNKRKIDQYTELPRIIKNYEKEIKAIKKFKKMKLNFQFIKLIPDTNFSFITPESKKILSSQDATNIFQDFANQIKKISKNYPTKINVLLFSSLLKKSGMTLAYKKAYKKVMNTIDKSNFNNKILKLQIARTKKHMGIKNNNYAILVAKRTIATYAAEGLILEKLSKTKKFPNCIWLNFSEKNKRTIYITNYLRSEKMPMFLL